MIVLTAEARAAVLLDGMRAGSGDTIEGSGFAFDNRNATAT